MSVFRWCIAHANNIYARQVITINNLCHAWVILRLTRFLYTKIGVSAWIFWKFSLQVKIRYLRQPLVKCLQQLYEYSKNELVLKLIDEFLARCYASLTTQSSYFVWSTTSRNLNQLKKLGCWNHHEKFYLLIKFEENLRWWVDFSIYFCSYVMEWPCSHCLLETKTVNSCTLISQIC